MSEAQPEKRRLSLRARLLLWIGVPLLLLLGLLLSIDGYGSSKLNSAMRQARADGGPVTLDELMAARKVYRGDENGAKVISDLAVRLSQIENEEQGQVLLLKVLDDGPPLGRRLTRDEAQAAAAALRQLEPELARIDRLRRYRGGRFTIEIMPNPQDTLLSHLSPLRTSAKIKSAQTRYRAMQGDTTGLVDDIDVLLVHGATLADEPTLISALVRMACDALALQTIERVCALTAVPAERLEAIQQRVAAMENQDRLSWGIRGERALFIGMLDYVRKPGSGSGGNVVPVPRGVGRVPGVRGWLMQDEATGLRLFNQLVGALGDRNHALRIAREISATIEKLPSYNVITRMMMPAMERCFELDGIQEARIRATLAGLAAERFRLDTGRFPARLDELVPKYLERVPLDPFDEQPLRYAVKPDKVIIYSIGPDGEDNGGDLDEMKGSRGKPIDHGFTLLPPDRRGLPASQPASAASIDE